MKRIEFLRLLESMLQRPAQSLVGSEELEPLGWDSLNGLEFLVLVDENFNGFQISPEHLGEVSTIDDLIALLQGRVV